MYLFLLLSKCGLKSSSRCFGLSFIGSRILIYKSLLHKVLNTWVILRVHRSCIHFSIVNVYVFEFSNGDHLGGLPLRFRP